MIALLLYALVYTLIAALAFWAVSQVGWPPPIPMIAKSIIAIAYVLALLSLMGFGDYLTLPMNHPRL